MAGEDHAQHRSVFAADTATAKASVSIVRRYHFSGRHLMSAVRLARFGATMEQQYAPDAQRAGVLSAEQFIEYQGFAIGAVVLAAFALEARINELFADAADQPDQCKLDQATKLSYGLLWKENVLEKPSALEKYLTAVILSGNDPQKLKSKNEYGSALSLTKLRNALAHYKPTSIADDTNLHSYLIGKFPETPWVGAPTPFFPDRCLSAGCAKWAVEAVLAFDYLFSSLIGIPTEFSNLSVS